MKTWEIKLEIKIADSWVADGFNMSEHLEDLKDKIADLVPYAYNHEFQVKAIITKAPEQKEIEGLQLGIIEIKD